MRKTILIVIGILILAVSFVFYETDVKADDPKIANYVGAGACSGCHSTYFNDWKATLHAQIHMTPGPGTVRPNWAGIISMGASYSNATVTLSIAGGVYKVTLNPTSGPTATYDVAYTYGGGWKQRYLTHINNTYYAMMPIQYNLLKYMNNTSGDWVTYHPERWFNTDGTLKSINTNSFRSKAYDKNCAGCHMTGLGITKNVSSGDTSWTATWANSNDTLNNKISCEACHGPGSDHIGGPSTSNIYGPTQMNAAPLARQQELCGQCHFRGSSSNKTYGYAWNETSNAGYQPGQVLANYMAPWQTLLNVTGGPGMWPDSVTSRRHHQQWQDQAFNSPHNNAMNCYKCHYSHKVGTVGHQLKLENDNNDVCLQCHTYFGSVGNPNTTKIANHTKHTYDPENNNNTGGASRCSKCHMPKTAKSAKSYDIHSHTFRVVSPQKTLDHMGTTSPTNGHINSCAASCHRNPGATTNIPNLGVGTDATLTNWRESTDSLLADTLWRWWQNQNWTINVQQISSELPKGYDLYQNFPNPFNPITDIRFAIPKNGHVSIKIYDITGREVFELVNEELKAGTYSVKWNSMNNQGSFASSGVYFYRIISSDFVQTKKMILVK
jgi:predicted CXXCH cytochrome family protein